VMLTDEKHAALVRVLLVAGGQINDLECLWLLQLLEAEGPYDGPAQLNDLWQSWLDREGVAPGALPDRKWEYFSTITGIDAARPDVELEFWRQLS